jgi:hypothetical protein
MLHVKANCSMLSLGQGEDRADPSGRLGLRSGTSECSHIRQDGVELVGEGVGGRRGRQEGRYRQEEEAE